MTLPNVLLQAWIGVLDRDNLRTCDHYYHTRQSWSYHGGDFVRVLVITQGWLSWKHSWQKFEQVSPETAGDTLPASVYANKSESAPTQARCIVVRPLACTTCIVHQMISPSLSTHTRVVSDLSVVGWVDVLTRHHTGFLSPFARGRVRLQQLVVQFNNTAVTQYYRCNKVYRCGRRIR